MAPSETFEFRLVLYSLEIRNKQWNDYVGSFSPEHRRLQGLLHSQLRFSASFFFSSFVICLTGEGGDERTQHQDLEFQQVLLCEIVEE